MMRRPVSCRARIASTVVALTGSADRNESGGRSIDGDEHRRLAFGAHGVGLPSEAVDADAKVSHHGSIAERHLPALHGTTDALASDRLELSVCRTYHGTALRRAFDDGFGQRVFRTAFQRGGK